MQDEWGDLIPAKPGKNRTWNKLLKLAQERDIEVFWTDHIIFNGYKANGLAGRYRGGQRIIILDKKLKGRILNHVMAHELGHSVLHPVIPAAYRTDEEVHDKFEIEADCFAVILVRCEMERNKRNPDLDFVARITREALESEEIKQKLLERRKH